MKRPDSSEAQAGEDIDRSPPIMIFLSGESFLHAGQHLRKGNEAGELRLRFEDPIYHLYCHAFELTMKAFLRAKGLTPHRLTSRELRHSLGALWNECVNQGLQADPGRFTSVTDIIELLEPFAAKHEFRYPRVGIRTLPVLNEVESAIDRLRAAVAPHCSAKPTSPPGVPITQTG